MAHNAGHIEDDWHSPAHSAPRENGRTQRTKNLHRSNPNAAAVCHFYTRKTITFFLKNFFQNSYIFVQKNILITETVIRFRKNNFKMNYYFIINKIIFFNMFS